MTELVERVARAVERELDKRCGRTECTLLDADIAAIARAAIEALRVPTPAMCDAAYAFHRRGGPAMFEGIWRAMIDV